MLIRQPHLYAPMVAAATFIVAAECSRVGIKTGYDGFEYPFWKILLDRGYHGRIGHAFSEEMSLLVYRNFDYKRERLNPRVQDASGLIYCSSRNPDVLVTTGDIQPNDSITKALPCHSNHGPIVLYWSSNAYQKLTNQISSISRR